MQNKNLIILGVLVVAMLYMGGYLYSVIPIDRQAFVGIPFHIQFATGRAAISSSYTCSEQGQATASLIQSITIKDYSTGTYTTPINHYANPDCLASQYIWSEFVWTPTKAGNFEVKSEVRDTYSNEVLVLDEWPFSVQASSSPACTLGQKKCDTGNSGYIINCGTEGQYTVWGDFCPAGCSEPIAGAAACNQLCTPNSYVCVPGTTIWYKTCSADGSNWASEAYCAGTNQVCAAGYSTPCQVRLPVCGNGVCEVGETCPNDCDSSVVCGDGVCATNEVCASDCGEQLPINVCGNKVCETGEDANDANICPIDCGIQSITGLLAGLGIVAVVAILAVAYLLLRKRK